MVAMRYYGNVIDVIDVIDVFYIFNSTVID